MQSEQIGELVAALAKAQGEMGNVGKDSKGYGYSYASLANAIDTTREALSKNGLAVIQTTRPDDGICVVTTLAHSSGQWIRGELLLPKIGGKRMNEAQEIGSSISYARRYAYLAILGLATDDDDAASLSRKDKVIDHAQKQFDSKPKDYGDRPRRKEIQRPKPNNSNKIKTLDDAKKRFPDLGPKSPLKQIDYGVDTSDQAIADCVGKPIEDCVAWIDYVMAHAKGDWKELDSRARALCLWAKELRK